MSRFTEFDVRTPPEIAYDEAVESAVKLGKNLTSTEFAQIVLSGYSLWKATGNGLAWFEYGVAADASVKAGVMDKGEIAELTHAVYTQENLIHNVNFEEESVHDIVQGWKDEGYTVGFKHGHYRWLTMPQKIGIILARRHCDRLVLGIEKQERTRDFKGKKILLPDDVRTNIYAHAFLADMLLMTKGDDYSNEYYRDLLKLISPNVYFIANDWSEEMKREARVRADMVGAKLIVSPTFPGDYSTTSIERFLTTNR